MQAPYHSETSRRAEPHIFCPGAATRPYWTLVRYAPCDHLPKATTATHLWLSPPIEARLVLLRRPGFFLLGFFLLKDESAPDLLEDGALSGNQEAKFTTAPSSCPSYFFMIGGLPAPLNWPARRFRSCSSGSCVCEPGPCAPGVGGL